MSTKNWQLDLLLMMGFGAGLYSFLKGFRIYREYRILEDTPEVPIRGVAMGLIHVRGQAARRGDSDQSGHPHTLRLLQGRPRKVGERQEPERMETLCHRYSRRADLPPGSHR